LLNHAAPKLFRETEKGKPLGKPVTLVTLEHASAPTPWRFWWLGIALVSLAGWGGIIFLAVALRKLL
jgi:hypothetical protein